MDLICPICGEPLDFDSIHENDRELPFQEAYRLFRTKGCGSIFDGVDCQPTKNSDIRLELAEMLGDDADGYAAMMEDFGPMMENL